MDNKLRKTILWTLYFIVVFFILIGVFFPAVILMIQPICFPTTDISGFAGWIQTAGLVISFASVALGLFSVYQASKSETEMKTVLNTIRETTKVISVKQDELSMYLHAPNIHFGDSTTQSSNWKRDDVKE